MDYLIPTLSKDFQGVIPRPSTSDRGLRWLKEALVRQGVDQDLVTPLTWHSFRVFIPDCAYQLGIPRAQRQYLGNWQTESTADIYTREKRNVVVDIWSKVLGKIQEVDLQPGRTVREDLAHPDWDDKPLDKPGDTESVNDSNGFELVQSDAETGLIESEGGPNSASTQHTSASRRTRTAAKSSELLRPLFQEIFADEVAPPVGPLVVVASLRKTGNPPKRKLHLLDRDGRAVGCGWSPDLTKVSSMTKDDYDSEAADLFHCTRCFHRFRLPSDWGVQSSLTDSSVDTASDSEKILLPEIKEGEESHLPVHSSWKRRQRTAAAGGARIPFPLTETVDLAVTSCCQWRRLVLGLPICQAALDRGILRFWGVVTPVLRLWVGHKGSPLHTALVERHKLLVLGGLPQQTVFWNQNLTHRNHK